MFEVTFDELAGRHPNPEPTEDLDIVIMSEVELLAAIERGEMNCVACVAATYRSLSRTAQ
jgi:hypothetical protein